MSQNDIPDTIRTTDLMRSIALACIEYPESIPLEVEVLDETEQPYRVVGVEHVTESNAIRIHIRPKDMP